MNTLIEIQFLTFLDTDRFVELSTDTSDDLFELRNDPKESSISWKTEGDFCKHVHLIWQDKLFNAWISRKEMFGAPMLLFWCAEAGMKEWFPEESLLNNGGRSFQIQDGKSVGVAHSNKRTLEVSGDMSHIRLREVKM